MESVFSDNALSFLFGAVGIVNLCGQWILVLYTVHIGTDAEFVFEEGIANGVGLFNIYTSLCNG